MLRYTLLRVLGAIPTLLLVIVLAFLMVHAAPGGPFDDERGLPADIEANIAAAYDLEPEELADLGANNPRPDGRRVPYEHVFDAHRSAVDRAWGRSDRCWRSSTFVSGAGCRTRRR